MVVPGNGSDPGAVISLGDGHVIGKLSPQFGAQPQHPNMSITAVAVAPDAKLIPPPGQERSPRQAMVIRLSLLAPRKTYSL